MRRRRARLITFAAAAVLLLGLATRIHVAYLAVLVLAESATPLVDGPIATRRPDPTVETVSFLAGSQPILADVYRPAAEGPHPGIVLNHGVADLGKDDPRLINFADAVARAGYVALVPEFENLKRFRVRPSDVEEIIASFEYLSGLPDVRAERVGLFGFSYAGGLTVLAASDPRIADRVRFCFLLGSYYDLENVVTYMTTGMYRRDGAWAYLEPRNSGRWAFLINSADLIEDEGDREALVEIARAKWDDPDADVGGLVVSLGEEGRRAYQLMINDDPDRTPALIDALSPRVREYLDALSLEGRIDRLRAHLIVGHGRDDSMIPYTESLLLAGKIPTGASVHLAILESFQHVDLKLGGGEGPGAFFASIAEVGRLFRVTYDLLAQGLL
jgi:dienelactone hydrolase